MTRTRKPKTTTSKASTILDLPTELLTDILLRLSLKDLIRSTAVSKDLNAFIRSRRFIKAHLDRSSRRAAVLLLPCDLSPLKLLRYNEDDGAFHSDPATIEQPFLNNYVNTFVGSSIRGVVCIKGYENLGFFNPSIRKFKEIPLPVYELEPEMIKYYATNGFGYDSVNDDFKLLSLAFFKKKECGRIVSRAKIYSLKSNSWRRIQDVPCRGFTIATANVVFLNGTLIWLMFHNKNNRTPYMILSLDLATEVYREIPLPADPNYSLLGALVVDVFEDHLCIGFDHFKTRHEIIWVMKEYGVVESWTMVRLAELKQVGDLSPLVFSKNDGMLLLPNNNNKLHWNHSKVSCRSCQATTYMESLCLLDGVM